MSKSLKDILKQSIIIKYFKKIRRIIFSGFLFSIFFSFVQSLFLICFFLHTLYFALYCIITHTLYFTSYCIIAYTIYSALYFTSYCIITYTTYFALYYSVSYNSSYFFAEVFHEKSAFIALSTILFHSRFLS